MASNLRIIDNKLVHVDGQVALESSLRKYAEEASIHPDRPVVVITESLFEQLKLHAQLNVCA
jgi:hypothetical protein